MNDAPATDETRCTFCGHACPLEAVTADEEGSDPNRVFCSRACRDAFRENEDGFPRENGHRTLDTGVAALEASLPQGLPRNSFVLLVGNSGTREEAIQAELVWRALERGEPAIVVAFTEPPTSVVENFLTMDWNVLPYLESGQLRVLDCFTSRMDDPERLHDRMTEWNTHLRRVVEPQTTTVRDPGDAHEVLNVLDNGLEDLEMIETGLVVVDSIAEFASLVQPVQAYDFVRDARAEVCKGRFVPLIAGGTVAGGEEVFPRNLAYAVDGVIDLALDNSIVEDTLFRRLRVRKLRGVLAISEWHTYEYTSGLGMVTFDPLEEIEGDRDDGGGDRDGEGEETGDADGPIERGDDKSNGTEDVTSGPNDPRDDVDRDDRIDRPHTEERNS
ncbi:ATPase domain-containing protein [Natronosalvus rutilus]|uniref:Recombinase RecA n=1 Tax=Natronosalvus rutilus TaxID=2953753 RepID=A0A9E7NB78_9EURY|nr:ATPase domain-containing protein [Natronosalvus rutilus]UTF54241.1 recombinase RecA [Natronosalvus rutilus]